MSLLPSCPSCGQSVLDDEAVDCPFCGASMKGGKSGAKPSAPTSKPASPAKKAEAKKSAAPADDNPFGATNPMAGRKAIQLLAKPGKGKLHRIVCPMCEAPGFWSKDIGGQEVKCANPECLMPIFTAPYPDGEAPAAPAKPASGNKKAASEESKTPAAPKSKLIPAVVVIAVLGVGGLVWVKMSGSNAAKEAASLDKPWTPPPASAVSTDTNTETAADPMNDPDKAVDPAKALTTTTKPALPSNDEIRAEGLKRIIEFAADPENRNRKEASRRMTAETMAHLSDIAAVDQQLKQFELVGGDQVKYYQIGPLSIAIWNRLAANDMAQAKAIFERATAFVPDLPSTGAFPLELAVEMSSLFIVFDQQDNAIKLISGMKADADLEAQVEAQLRAERSGQFDLASAIEARSIAAKSRSWSMVGFNLVMRGQSAKAIAWAKAAPDANSQADSLAAVAEGLIATGANLDSINADIAQQSATYQARIWARVAIAQHLAGNADLSKQALKKATDASSSIAAIETPKLPDVVGIHNLKLSDMTARMNDAQSIAEVSHAQALTGDVTAAWATLQTATNLARSTAPMSFEIEKMQAELMAKGDAAVKSTLKTELKLKLENEVDRAVSDFHRNLRALAETSRLRSLLLATLYETACEWGLSEQVWTELKARASATDPTRLEAWFETRLPAVCEAYCRASGKTDIVSEIEQTVGAERLKNKPAFRAVYRHEAFRLAEAGTPLSGTQAANKLKEFVKVSKDNGDRIWQEQLFARIASQYVSSGKTQAALSLATAMDDPFAREMLFEFIASQATRKGDIEPLRAFAFNRSVLPPDRVSVLRGLLVNLPK